MDESNIYYDAVISACEKGYMIGVAEDIFAHDGYLARGMAARILWNMAGQPEPIAVAPFLDVTSDEWYAVPVAWAYEQGIVVGYDSETFGPNDYLTMEQFNIMLAKYRGEVVPEYIGTSLMRREDMLRRR